jgi:ElaB/YqjD/DUF883 family membrane-anchored ribosome-binding protein
MQTNESVGTSAGASRRRRPTALESTPEELRNAADDLASSAEQLYRVGDAFLGKHAEQKPYLILGAAAGVGFILGGGLASRLAGSLVNLAGRMAVSHALDAWMTSKVVSSASTGPADAK